MRRSLVKRPCPALRCGKAPFDSDSQAALWGGLTFRRNTYENAQMKTRILFGAFAVLLALTAGADARRRAARVVAPAPAIASLLAEVAKHYGMPEALLHRVVREESGFNPAARNGPYWGLMQIRLDTARGVGYRGGGAGLLDARTNLIYGGAYLANAWRVSGGKEAHAIRLYRGGYYYAAKRRGMLKSLVRVP